MATKNADVLDNTCYDNSQAKYPPSNLSKSATWAGEIVSQTANKNKFRRNIGVSTHAKKNYTNPTTGKSYAGAAGGFANAGYETLEKATNNSTGDNYSYTFPMTGNTIVDNLFFGYLKPGYSASTFKASIDTNIVSGAQGVDASTNLLGSKIGLTSAAQIWENPDPTPANNSVQAIITAVPDFRLKAGSRARNAASDGTHIGAWKGGVTPPPPETFTVTAPGVMTIGGSPIGGTTDNPTYPVGAPVTFTAASYNSAPDSRSFIVQWWNGSTYETKAATITGPVSGTYTVVGGAPAVTAEGGLRILETGAKAGFTSINTPTNWINIAPAPVSTDKPPVNTALPVISPSTPVVGAACSVSTGTWTGNPAPTFTYQWKAAGTNISGATSASYTPVSGDKTKALTCAVTGTNSVGSATAVSAATSAVTDPTTLTLAEVSVRLPAAEGKIATLESNVAALTARTDAQDVAIEEIEANFGARIGTLEIDAGGLRERVDAIETQSAETVNHVNDIEDSLVALAARVGDLEDGGGGGGGGGGGRQIQFADIIGPIAAATDAQRQALRDVLGLSAVEFVGVAQVGSGTIDFSNALMGGGTIQPGDLLLEFGMRTNATLPSPSPAIGWTQMFADYSNATPWQVLGWTRRFVAGDTDPMPTTHRKLLLVYRNCALGAVSTPLTGTGTTASVPAISVANGGWTAGFIAARAAQSDMDTALLAGGLTTRREAANGSDVNSHAYADSNGPSVGFTQRDQTIASTAWFGVSFSLIRT